MLACYQLSDNLIFILFWFSIRFLRWNRRRMTVTVERLETKSNQDDQREVYHRPGGGLRNTYICGGKKLISTLETSFHWATARCPSGARWATKMPTQKIYIKHTRRRRRRRRRRWRRQFSGYNSSRAIAIFSQTTDNSSDTAALNQILHSTREMGL